MPRRKNITPSASIHLHIPEDVKARLDLFLYSEVESRVPVGAYQAFFQQRIQEFFDWKRIPLDSFGFPPGYFVIAPREMLQALVQRLHGAKGEDNANT